MKYTINYCRTILSAAIVFTLTSCGSGGSGGGSNIVCQTELDFIEPVIVNATQLDGVTTRSSYDSDSATFVIDGITDDENYWTGMTAGDYLEVDLGVIQEADTIELHLKVLDDIQTRNVYEVLVSTDGNEWHETLYSPTPFTDDRTYSCTALGTSGPESRLCELRSPNPGFRYIRFVYISDNQDEILALGVREFSIYKTDYIRHETAVCE